MEEVGEYSGRQTNSLRSKIFEDNIEYTMVHSTGGNFWDFWLSEVDEIINIGGWKLKIRNKVQSCELQEMVAVKPDKIAVILLPSGVGARVKILTETTKDKFGAYNLSAIDVDTGEFMITCVEKVYEPDEQILAKETFAVNCCLNLDKNFYNEAFKKHIQGGLLKVKFLRVSLSSPPKFVVDIHVRRKEGIISLIDLLHPESCSSLPKNNSNIQVESPESNILTLERKKKISEKGEAVLDISVAHVDSISKFFIWESIDHKKELESLMVDMKSFYKSTSTHIPNNFISSLSKGTICAALDEKTCDWYRAEIVAESNRSSYKGLVQKYFEVLLVDFGNRIEVPISSIRQLHSNFFSKPVYAIQCHLFGLEPLSSLKSADGLDYSKDVIEIFEMLLDLGKLTLIEAPTKGNDKKDSIPVILERNYKGKDHVINIDLLAQKLVDSSVFNIDECSALLKNINSGKIEMNVSSSPLINSFSDDKSSLPEHNMPKEEPKDVDEELGDWNPMEDDFKESEFTYQGIVNDDASAMIGYQAKDEARICKFYGTTGHCFKGSSCRKEHSFIRPDGLTTDTQLVFASAFSYLSLPRKGSLVKLHVTVVTDMCKFYATLHDAWRYRETSHEYVPNERNPEENLENLLTLINSKENVAALKRLVMPPGVGELILCKMMPSNLYYRAQVIDTNLEENLFLVLFIDIGSMVWEHAKNMRQIENRYLHLPFQAIDCQLAYCGPPENIDGSRKMEIMKKLTDMIASKAMKAYVVSSISAINKMVVELVDEEGVNVGKVLKKEGYLKESPEMYESNLKYIPG